MRPVIAMRVGSWCVAWLACVSAALAQEEVRKLTPEELTQIRARANANRASERPQAALLIAPRMATALPVGGTQVGPSVGLGVEYVTPFLDRRLTLAAQGQWTALSYQHLALPFIDDAAFQTRVRQTSVALAAVLRTTGLGRGGEAYVGAGPGVFVTSVETAFGRGKRGENDVRLGVAGFAGIDLYVGPGSIFFELHAQYARSSLPALGRSSVVPLSLGIGYRFVLPR
jgi:hypothetical protein